MRGRLNAALRLPGPRRFDIACLGRLVYGMSERRLLELTGNHAENPTLDLPCREVFARGQKDVQVIGPVPEIEDEIAALHRAFWHAR